MNQLEACKVVFDLMNDIALHFSKTFDNIKVHFDGENTVFTVEDSVADLGEAQYSSSDYEIFCKSNNLVGVIFFNRNGSVTFSMEVKTNN